MSQITSTEHNALSEAYTYYNAALFDGELPDCLITLNRSNKPRNLGFYQKNAIEQRQCADPQRTDQITLNIVNFHWRTDTEILSTLVHEMVHLWQFHFGDPPRNGYHDKQFGRKMKDVGLHPSNTGQPGGKETGQQMDHYVMDGGQFEEVTAELIASGFKLNWQLVQEPAKEAKERKKNKIKYSCPECDANAWGKPELRLICGECMCEFIAEDGEE